MSCHHLFFGIHGSTTEGFPGASTCLTPALVIFYSRSRIKIWINDMLNAHDLKLFLKIDFWRFGEVSPLLCIFM